jgi:hypothetical protein
MWELSRVWDKENFSRDVIIKPDKTMLFHWFEEKRMEIVVLSKKKNVTKKGGHDLDVPCMFVIVS